MNSPLVELEDEFFRQIYFFWQAAGRGVFASLPAEEFRLYLVQSAAAADLMDNRGTSRRELGWDG